MNRQEIFNTVYTRLMTQGRRAMNGKACAYLAPNGNRCAVGHLIPDGHAGLMATCDVDSLILRHTDLADLFEIESHEDRHFLMGIQGAHDNCYDIRDFRETFKRNMQKIADCYELTVPHE